MNRVRRTRIPVPLMALIATLSIGCDKDARLAELAREAADRQARQNAEMARVHREVAAGTKQLVEADADARRELIVAQRDLQTQQSAIGQQRDELEVERKAIARQRLTESRLGPVLNSGLLVGLAIVTITFCLLLLLGLRRNDDADQALNELLVEELASPSPRFVPLTAPEPSRQDRLPDSTNNDVPPRIDHE